MLDLAAQAYLGVRRAGQLHDPRTAGEVRLARPTARHRLERIQAQRGEEPRDELAICLGRGRRGVAAGAEIHPSGSGGASAASAGMSSSGVTGASSSGPRSANHATMPPASASAEAPAYSVIGPAVSYT